MDGSTSDSPAPVVADSSAAATPFLLPDHPPDYSAPDLYEDLDSVWHAPADAMAVVFVAGLSRDRKTRLVAEVGAYELADGSPVREGLRMDGIYIVRIHTDGTMGPILEAIKILRDSPDIVTAFTLTTLGGGAANDSATAAGTAESTMPFLLPEHPPDTVAEGLYDDLDPIWLAPVDVFAVNFRLGLTREHKTRLVVDVGAVGLVGGAPISDGLEDGVYLIRIRTDGTMDPLRKAVDALNAHPDVAWAMILTPIG